MHSAHFWLRLWVKQSASSFGRSNADYWRGSRRSALHENTQNSISASPSPSPLPPPLVDTVSSVSHTQTESSDGAFQKTGPGRSGEGKGKAGTSDGHTGDGHTGDGHTGDGHCGDGDKQDRDQTATGATRIRVSSKRATDMAGLNDEGEGIPRSEKVQRTGESAGHSRFGP